MGLALLALAGCSGGGDDGDAAIAADAPPAFDGAPDAISPDAIFGRVVNRFLDPYVGVRVGIAGVGETVTDAEGRFFFAAAPAEYDLFLLDDAGGQVILYDDLHRRDPVAVLAPAVIDGSTPELERSAGVGGTAAPGFPPMPDENAQVSIGGLVVNDVVVPSPVTGDYLLEDLPWHGAPDRAATVHALIWLEGAGELPVAYAYGSTAVTLTDGTIGDADVTLAPLATMPFDATFTFPAGFATPGLSAFLFTVDGARFDLGGGNGATITFEAPELDGAQLVVRAYAARSDLSGATAGATIAGIQPGDDVTIALPEPPELLAPASGVDDVDASTLFTWLPYDGGLHAVAFNPLDPAAAPRFVVLTAAASATLPAASEFGVPVPAATSYFWLISATAPVADTDAITDPALLAAGFVPPTHTEGNSVSRQFVTAP
jgi:hypothetical protein